MAWFVKLADNIDRFFASLTIELRRHWQLKWATLPAKPGYTSKAATELGYTGN